MLPAGFAAASLTALLRGCTKANTPQTFVQAPQLVTLSCFSAQALPTIARQVRHSSSAPALGIARKGWLQEVRGWSKILKQLSKARLSALVVSTTTVGYIAGSGEQISWKDLCWTAVGTFGAAACANTLNQVYEVANDARMKRTMMRPLPLGKVTRMQALAFAGLVGAGGIFILAEKANLLTAGLGVTNIVLYAGIYTPLKVVSAANTWVGALVGAIPPLMGWTAASGALEPGAAVLAAALYFWQLPHFLSLAWLCRDDYMRGGYAMLPRFDATGKRTAACALRNSLYMLPIGVFAVWVGTAAMPFAYEASIAAGTLATTAAVFFQKPSQRSARMLFRFSILFLPLFMAGLVVHRIPNTHTVTFETLREKMSQGFSLTAADGKAVSKQRWPLREISAVPLPFLPLPLELRCPAKASCEAAREQSRDGIGD